MLTQKRVCDNRFEGKYKLYMFSEHINVCDNSMTLTKSETIKASLKATKEKRKNQTCRVFEIKIDKSHLNIETEEHLHTMFLEAKWLYNHILSQDNVFETDDKIHEVPVKVKDVYEIREINCLSSQMRQSIISRTTDNIKGLSRLKTNGHDTGKLKFKNEVRSIPLKQYDNTYKIIGDKFIKIQGIKQKIRVNGLDQIPDEVDLANGTLIHKNGDYYLSVTTYQAIERTNLPVPIPIRQVGIDFGLDRQLTLSDGIAIQYSIQVSKQLRKLNKKLSKQKPHSKNWNKTKIHINREYSKLNNIKKDIKNKIVSHLSGNYETVCYQNENVKAWQRIWGRKILSTSIGGIISTLSKKVHTPIEVPGRFPSTKTCSVCDNIQDIALSQRKYVCEKCKSVMDRDHNSSNNILNYGLKQVDTVRIELTPEEILTSTLAYMEYLNSIPYVRASLVVESGSLTAFCEA